MFCTYHFTFKCQVLFFLNCKVANNTLKILWMCYSWGIHMHISCGWIPLTFHMFYKHGSTSQLQLIKTDLNFENLKCTLLHNELCSVFAEPQNFFFSPHLADRVSVIAQGLFNPELAFTVFNVYTCFFFVSSTQTEQVSLYILENSLTPPKKCTLHLWEQYYSYKTYLRFGAGGASVGKNTCPTSMRNWAPCKEPDIDAYTCDPSAAGIRDRRIVWTYWPMV